MSEETGLVSNFTKPMAGFVPALDPNKLSKAVARADLRPLLMTLSHRTGDPAWLTDRYRPKRDVQLIADEDAGIADDAAEEIRSAARSVLAEDYDCALALEALSDARFKQMMEFFLSEDVPDEYLPMMREQLGFQSPIDGVSPLDMTALLQGSEVA
ncbi:MAG: hypothetical protein AAGL49_13825, partial [Pseudomonadota bacterium]